MSISAYPLSLEEEKAQRLKLTHSLELEAELIMRKNHDMAAFISHIIASTNQIMTAKVLHQEDSKLAGRNQLSTLNNQQLKVNITLHTPHPITSSRTLPAPPCLAPFPSHAKSPEG
ncbi:hypothetical protein EYC84_001769 [Monilinia fructicola]|uniref:Uncharacterized protein n=1 Tax=Monilinia fructicola TaxID=38448 RepID=A0A5M9JVJ1_MONFR|nr:hypothetical protein EYC84_001769 [Monilinia fructicola]